MAKKIKLTTVITSCEMVKGGAKLKFGKAKLTTGQRGEIGEMVNNGEEVNLTIELAQNLIPTNSS